MDIEQLLERYTPTELEKELESACPFFGEAVNTFSSVYLPVHELANNLLAVKLQERLNGIEIATEQQLKGANGLVDIRVSAKNGKLDVRGPRQKVAIIELKTGVFNLVQPAVYAFKEGIDVLLVGLKNSEVQVVSPELAESLLQTVAEHLETKGKLKKEDSHLPSNCKRCANFDCGYAEGKGLELNKRSDIYEKKVQLLNGSLDIVAGKIEAHLRGRLKNGLESQKISQKA